MECPNCHKENAEGSRFCIHCGSPFPEVDAEAPSVPEQGAAGTLAEQLQSLQQDVRRLEGALARMNNRLVVLERGRVIPTPPPELRPAPRAVAPAPETVPGPAVEAPARAEVPRPPPEEGVLSRAREWDWEQILGGNWLARIGVLALIIGAAFFLKFAFDNNWIGPTGQVVLGILAGLAMLGGGEYWQRRYPTFAQAFGGGGVALLYLSIFAAFATYSLIGVHLAVGFLLLVSIVSAALAIRHESMALGIIGVAGAFGAPFILGGFAPAARAAAEGGQSIQLLVYVMVVDLGVLALSTFRNWRWFTLLALVGSLAAFGGWFAQFGGEASLLTSQGGLTLIFLIFVAATTLYHIVWRRAPQAFDQSLMIVNAAAYFGISYGLLWEDFRPWMGGFSVILALFYGGLAYAAFRRSTENVRLSFFALGIALVFLTVAIPVQLGDRAWTTIAWAAEAVVLIWLSFILRMPRLRLFGYGAFIPVAVRLFFFDTPVNISTFQPVLNERFLAFAVSIAAMYFTAYLLWRRRNALHEWEERVWSVYPVFVVIANFFSLWVLTAEVLNYFGNRLHNLAYARDPSYYAERSGLQNARNLSLTALWAVYSVIVLVVGIVKGSRAVRIAALAMLAVPVAKVFVYDVFTLERVYRIIAFTGLGALLIAGGYLYQRYRRAIRGFLVEK